MDYPRCQFCFRGCRRLKLVAFRRLSRSDPEGLTGKLFEQAVLKSMKGARRSASRSRASRSQHRTGKFVEPEGFWGTMHDFRKRHCKSVSVKHGFERRFSRFQAGESDPENRRPDSDQCTGQVFLDYTKFSAVQAATAWSLALCSCYMFVPDGKLFWAISALAATVLHRMNLWNPLDRLKLSNTSRILFCTCLLCQQLAGHLRPSRDGCRVTSQSHRSDTSHVAGVQKVHTQPVPSNKQIIRLWGQQWNALLD